MTVTDVIDGDTIDIQFGNGSTDTVRLLGVDTPEIHTQTDPTEFEGVPDTERGQACLREAGHAASEYATARLLSEQIQLTFDAQADRRGAYGRLLAYVILDGQNFNLNLIEGGHARVYDSRFSESSRFYNAETIAQNRELGVWRCRTIQPTPTTTTTTAPPSGSGGQLAIAEIHADAAGNDHTNENDEYIVFTNTGSSRLDLSGWRIEDEAGHTYHVPRGVTLSPGATITLYTGSGTDTDDKLYWGSGAAIWNNGGDTIIVFDGSGSVVLEETYG